MMSNRARKLLLLIAFVASVTGGARLALADGPRPEQARCRQVSIRAELTRQGRGYRQFGVGSVFTKSRFDSQLFIVTPAHVVSGAERVFALCGDQTFELNVLGRSLTADVALGSLGPAAREHLEPLFFSTDLERNAALASAPFTTDRAGKLNTRILITSFRRERGPESLPVYTLLPYKQTYMNPIFGDHGALIASSGVIPGMSGSALLINDAFSGLVTKTLLGDSTSGIVPASEIASLLPSLERGVDPYEENRLNPALLVESLVPTGDGRLVRWHSLKLRRPALEFKSACHAGAFMETSQWQESRGWGEGSGWSPARGWGEGGGGETAGSSLGALAPHLPFTMIYGVDLENERTKRPGAPIRYASVAIAHRADCEREGVILPDGRRLVALMTYPDPDTRSGHTLVVTSVDDLMPLARHVGSRLPELIERYGLFADDAKTQLTALCATNPFMRTNALEHKETLIVPIRHVAPTGIASSERMGEETTFTYVEELEPLWERIDLSTSSLGPDLPDEMLEDFAQKSKLMAARTGAAGWLRANIPFRNGLVCEESGALHLQHHRPDSPVKTDLQIFSDRVTGWIQVGQCRLELVEQAKDFWHARLENAKLDLQLEVGINMPAHAFVRLTPSRVDPSCWAGTRFENRATGEAAAGKSINRNNFGAILWLVN